jgi:hypothetical protein
MIQTVLRWLWHHANFVCRRNYTILHFGTDGFTIEELEYFEDGPQVTLIRPDIREWLDTNMPNRWQTRDPDDLPGSHRWLPFVNYYVFYRTQDAVLFKLTWGGKT